MKKNSMIICIALIALVLVFNVNSWAASNRGGPRQNQKWDKPANAMDKPDRGRSWAPRFQHHRPEGRFSPRLLKPDHHRAPYRFAPKPRPWFHRPFYRPFQPRWNLRRQHHGAVMNTYYRSAGSYAPEDAFSASATLSNTGFAVSVGVRATN
jgi:hypothetical protein